VDFQFPSSKVTTKLGRNFTLSGFFDMRQPQVDFSDLRHYYCGRSRFRRPAAAAGPSKNQHLAKKKGKLNVKFGKFTVKIVGKSACGYRKSTNSKLVQQSREKLKRRLHKSTYKNLKFLPATDEGGTKFDIVYSKNEYYRKKSKKKKNIAELRT